MRQFGDAFDAHRTTRWHGFHRRTPTHQRALNLRTEFVRDALL